MLRNKEGKYLLVERSDKKYPEAAGTWDLVGGRIDPGSTLLDNLKREVKEEIGLGVIGEVRLLAAQDILRVPGRHVVRLTYIGETEGKPILDEENKSYVWLTLSEMGKRENLDIYLKELVEKGIFD